MVSSIRAYHEVLLGLSGRRLIRDDYTRYEAVGYALVEVGLNAGALFPDFPPVDSPLAPERFFSSLLQTYDLRYPFTARKLKHKLSKSWRKKPSPTLEICSSGEDSSDSSCLGTNPK